jgi:hypothetical protein
MAALKMAMQVQHGLEMRLRGVAIPAASVA